MMNHDDSREEDRAPHAGGVPAGYQSFVLASASPYRLVDSPRQLPVRSPRS